MSGAVRGTRLDENLLVEMCVRALQGLEATVDHAQFFAQEGVRIQLVSASNPKFLLPDAMMIFDHNSNTIYIQNDDLPGFIEELGVRGLPKQESHQVVALKLVAMISHEICHGMNKKKMVELHGVVYNGSSIEDETICWATQARTLGELQSRNASLWKDDRFFLAGGAFEAADEALLEAWDRGPSSLRDFVRGHYHDRAEILKTERAALLTQFEANADALRNIVPGILRDPEKALREADPARKSELENLIRVMSHPGVRELFLRQTEDVIELLRKPEQFEIVKSFYARELDAQSPMWRDVGAQSQRDARLKKWDDKNVRGLEKMFGALQDTIAENNAGLVLAIVNGISGDYRLLSVDKQALYGEKLRGLSNALISLALQKLREYPLDEYALSPLEFLFPFCGLEDQRQVMLAYERAVVHALETARLFAASPQSINPKLILEKLILAEKYAAKAGLDVKSQIQEIRSMGPLARNGETEP
ncbi:MAG: hypothetical protein AAB268_03475 [Elusimicrobiota bacterium]